MSDANISAALAWLEGSWQAADNRREAARAAKCIRDQAVEIERLKRENCKLEATCQRYAEAMEEDGNV